MYYQDRIIIIWSRLVDALFRRGALAFSEITGGVILWRATLSGEFNFEAGLIGAGLLSISTVVEFLIWHTSLQLRELAKRNEELLQDYEREFGYPPKSAFRR